MNANKVNKALLSVLGIHPQDNFKSIRIDIRPDRLPLVIIEIDDVKVPTQSFTLVKSQQTKPAA